MFVFGSGVLIGTQLNVPNPTPINFGLVQKVSVDTSVSVKELYGQFAFPVAVGSGTRKVTCKATLARFSAQALGRLFYNQMPALGSTISSFAEVHTSPPAARSRSPTKCPALRGRPGRHLRRKRPSFGRCRYVDRGWAVLFQPNDRRLYIQHRRWLERPDHLQLRRLEHVATTTQNLRSAIR